ncbi:cytochrome P450 [Massariosphaeria phaeospora]|uniref:Cytochrome P450 n=1 Tax=Massariosphaeria phaeospora TaxID=100035 RepID=A0A7C8I7H7_9PLEO|nr:cytochrome P450 [Massariosphaeria phaeospora]
MLNGRTYVVTSPALASQIQRLSQTLSFEKIVLNALPRLVGLDKETVVIVQDVTADKENRVRMATTTIHDHFADFVNAVDDGQQVELFKFITREVHDASMHTFYGPENPFALHPELLEDFFSWENGIVGYMVGVAPQWTAAAAYSGLENCVKGFTEYLESGRISQAYQALQERQSAHDAVGISIPQQARLEVSMCLGLGVNAAITAFWLVNNIFNRPALLAQVREEIETNALFDDANTISASALRDACPLLNSCYRETMRIVAPMNSARFVKVDTLVADTYLLRKDTIVQIAGGALHTDAAIWGPDVAAFNPYRFIHHAFGTKTTAQTPAAPPASKQAQVHPAAFRAFGGGASLCPGRFFAQLEILSLAAILVVGFDMGDGVRWDPELQGGFSIAVTKPKTGVDVRLRRRKRFGERGWAMKM